MQVAYLEIRYTLIDVREEKKTEPNQVTSVADIEFPVRGHLVEWTSNHCVGGFFLGNLYVKKKDWHP